MKRLAAIATMTLIGVNNAAQADDALKAAIAAPTRTPDNVKRDVYRHPYETLTFFGIKPNMTVVELAPGVVTDIGVWPITSPYAHRYVPDKPEPGAGSPGAGPASE